MSWRSESPFTVGFRAYVGFWFHCSPNPEFEGRHIKRGGRLIALVDIETLYNRGQYGGTVSFTFDEEPSADEKTHFNQIALCLFQQKAHSLFACMDSVSYATRSFA
ncbi:hypothetical protein BGP82_26815 [Pseudomonas putida]|uniref:Uncharacterized protein n=1 Tax=Pseudomonas putida TaxID=303 RepID=A0A2S3WJU6_PSEPU|nr:hypothetical protein BGP82_26815 [Pseudomonas putida]